MHGTINMKRDLRADDQAKLAQLALAEKRGASLASPRPGHGKTAVPKPILELDEQCRARSVDDIAERIERLAAPEKSAIAVSRMNRIARKAERQAGDGSPVGGTGFTIIRHRQAPVASLLDKGKLGPEEVQSAQEIEQAFFAINSKGRLQGMTLDRVDGGRHSDLPWPASVADAVRNYQSWATFWSNRNKAYSDPMLEIVIAAVIDERPVREIAMDVGRRHSTVEQGLAAGLRHYAAWAGFVGGHVAARWMAGAESIFVHNNTKLTDAIRRARIEV